MKQLSRPRLPDASARFASAKGTLCAGDVIAILDDDQVRAREDAAKSAVQQAEARVRSSQQQISVLRAQEQSSSLSVDQSKSMLKVASIKREPR